MCRTQEVNWEGGNTEYKFINVHGKDEMKRGIKCKEKENCRRMSDCEAIQQNSTKMNLVISKYFIICMIEIFFKIFFTTIII